VFLVVVDPGVGTRRRAIAVESGGYRFVGPDNGVMSLAFGDPGTFQAVELVERKFARPLVSKTFEGRDRFAPAAGWLARGTALAAFGPAVADPMVLTVPIPQVSASRIDGEVVRIDRFGNLLTNIPEKTIGERPCRVVIAGHDVGLIVTTYGEVEPQTACALIGSSGFLEVAVRNGNAAAALGVNTGAPVIAFRRQD
jgi:S-adenosylmethionine hydrolase